MRLIKCEILVFFKKFEMMNQALPTIDAYPLVDIFPNQDF